MSEEKKWCVEYDHKDGRSGMVVVITEIRKSGAFSYGNGKSGMLSVSGYDCAYDLRYCREKDLHRAMLEDYFGDGLVKVTEI